MPPLPIHQTWREGAAGMGGGGSVTSPTQKHSRYRALTQVYDKKLSHQIRSLTCEVGIGFLEEIIFATHKILKI